MRVFSAPVPWVRGQRAGLKVDFGWTFGAWVDNQVGDFSSEANGKFADVSGRIRPLQSN